jgi:hypothetical protein
VNEAKSAGDFVPIRSDSFHFAWVSLNAMNETVARRRNRRGNPLAKKTSLCSCISWIVRYTPCLETKTSALQTRDMRTAEGML